MIPIKKHKQNSSRISRGVSWSALERFLSQGIQFVVTVVLARLLLPTDFGLIALVLVLLNILQIINEQGFSIALMYKLDRDDLDFSTVYVLNIILGLTLYGILYLSAPLLASFFELPQLTYLTRLIGLNLIFTSFIVVQRAKLLINVDFKTQAKASLLSTIISGIIGIYFAYRGLGVLSLVYQSLVFNGLNTLLIWQFVSWRPHLQFSFARFVKLFNFAYKLILARMINEVFKEIYSAIIVKQYSPSSLGYFNRANSFVVLSSNNIASIVQRVSTPILCEAQNNHQQMGRVLIKFITNTALIVYPILFGLFVLAKPLISVLLTDKWLPSAWILQVLCPVGLFYIISTFNRNVFNATGRTDWALKSEVMKKIIYLPIIFTAIWFGFTALIFSQVIIAIIEFLLDTYYTKKQIGVSIYTQLKAISNIVLACIIMIIIIWISTLYITNNFAKLAVGFFVGSLTYITYCIVFNVADTRIIFNKLKNRTW